MALNTDYLDKLLRLFSTLIIIDGKILPEEVEVMGQQLARITNMVDDGILFTPEMGKDWFIANQKQISTELMSQDRQRVISASLMGLVGLNQKFQQKILYAMIRISWADGEYHTEEENYVHLASMAWGLERSGQSGQFLQIA